MGVWSSLAGGGAGRRALGVALPLPTMLLALPAPADEPSHPSHRTPFALAGDDVQPVLRPAQ